MKYSVTGFPRIGAKRELKFATEAYFRGDVSLEELTKVVHEQREVQWKVQQAAGADFIPSNDYSLYDSVLDTAFTLNAIPKRYQDLGLGEVDTYFAAARGYQGEAGDVKAFSMKKWFNTNYHYLVPEIDDDATLQLRSTAFLDGYRQAKSLGITTKPVLVGPFTFLKLADFTGRKGIEDVLDDVVKAYAEAFRAAKEEGVSWLQLDEPYLVYDLSEADVALFARIYESLLPQKQGLHVLLQTYFGDIRDAYDVVTHLDFDGIGLDFIEGKQTESLVKTHGFPQDKLLFAGLVNGKNIWRTDYKKVLAKLGELRAAGIDVVLSTSCSLLHVPYTVANEPKLSQEVLQHFSFAYEKLGELKEITDLAELSDYASHKVFQANQSLFATSELRTDESVQQAVAALVEEDFNRPQTIQERQAAQKGIFQLPLLPTTTIGSFPQTKVVKENRKLFRQGEITEAEYRAKAKEFIKDCVALQEEIGLDVLVHGEFERNDMVEFFGENLSGFVFTSNAWVQSYGTRGVKPPIVFGDIKRKQAITTDYSAYANSLTTKEVKGMLTGPVTILNWSFPREDISTKEMMYQIGLAIREEVLDLEAAGIRIIQIDEAALREKLPLRRADWYSDYLDFAIKAFRLCHGKVQVGTQIHTHMCYSEFEDIISEIDAMDADVITFEASRSKLTLLDALLENNFQTEVGPGVYDIHSPRVPSVEEIKEAIRLIVAKIPVEHVWVNPDCGLKTRGERETVASLQHMVQAAKEIRAELAN
ncbi:5-methyltetrahydropteroyltriglutamate--homocysteine S-methyltransferase [Veillonella sp. VA142]|uniref:5-methyltetrahydropteroyltriglutamate-- homocysteine S-methyltransferase n=1 Tax=Veillonella sp. VA142 TaxID=741834 RepID=UPI000F8F518A|nr:5-methyltetrahydropteroyltriglutamate--homocysteine S-methyltransferase [Veillonella sp. VA142]